MITRLVRLKLASLFLELAAEDRICDRLGDVELIEAGSATNAPALANLVRGAILFFTAALALRQAGLPGDIVGIAFGSVVGAIAVGAAVAVGVGGRHVAGRLLEEVVEALRTSPPDTDTPPIKFPD